MWLMHNDFAPQCSCMFQGLGELLSSSMKTSPPELKSQLKYILGQLDSG